MGRIVKVFLWLVGGFAVLFILAALAIYVFFDPNDFREEISNSVKNQTGREFVIEGDISLDIFPWLAVEVGQASFGNAAGFGDEPMASFERASFSVRLLPAILRQEIVVGAANIHSLKLNLKVDQSGVTNWEDLIPQGSAAESDSDDDSGGGLNINSIQVINSSISYANAETGESIVLDGLQLDIGRLQDDGSDVPLSAELNFAIEPTGLSGSLELEMTLRFDAENGILGFDDVSLGGSVEGVAAIPTRMTLDTDGIEVALDEYQISMQVLDLTMLDMHIVADVQPFSYADRIAPRATIAIDAFSPRTLMQLFDVAPPDTADPVALSRVIVDANTELTAAAIELTDVTVKLDDTTFRGSLSVPRGPTGFFQFDLSGDSIDLARYMAPTNDTDSVESAAAVPVEIPVDLIKPLNARGKLELSHASLGNIVFEDVELGLNSSNGKMRLFPISSQLFGGAYRGDVRIDVSGTTPVLSLNEKIESVDLALLAKALFDQDNITGSIDGSFALTGSGENMAAIQRDLAGSMSLELKDGTYTGTDVWYEIRRARALLKGEQPPEPALPAKTEFSTMRMTGVVADGIMRSDDLFAELPFMQVTGGGMVDIPAGTVDYGMIARILERPEFLRDATAEELDEFTEAKIPLKVTGPLASPKIQPDLEELLKQQVEDEIKDLLKDKLKGLFD